MTKLISDKEKQSKKDLLFSSKFKNITIALSGVSIFLLFLVPQVTGLRIAEVSSFYTEDGHCVETTVLTKLHCFGDYGSAIEIVRSGKSIWTLEYGNAYPPINFQLYLLFSFIAAKVGYLFSLVLYLVTLVAAMIIPFLHALKNRSKNEKMVYISTAVVATFPFLIVLDRGNNNVWVLPFIYFFIAARYSKIPKRFDVLFAAIAIAFRPQNLLLLVVFFSKREYVKIFKTLVLSIVLNLLSFVLWDAKNFVNNALDQMNQIVHYSSGIPGTWPPSLSFSRGLKTITETSNLSIGDSILKNIGYAVGALIIFKIVKNKEKYSDSQVLYLVVPLMFLLPAQSWYYYSSLLLVVVAIAALLNSSVEEIGLNSKTRGNIFLFATILTTTPLCLPIWQGQYNITQSFVPMVWLLTYFVYIFGPQKKA